MSPQRKRKAFGARSFLLSSLAVVASALIILALVHGVTRATLLQSRFRSQSTVVQLVSLKLVEAASGKRRLLPQAFGSGTLVSPGGAILTAFHNVGDPATGRPFEMVLVLMVRHPEEVAVPVCHARPVRAMVDRDADLAVLMCEEDLTSRPVGHKNDYPWSLLREEPVRKGEVLVVMGYEGKSNGYLLEEATRVIGLNPSGMEIRTQVGSGISGGAAFDLQGRLAGVPVLTSRVPSDPSGSSTPLDPSGSSTRSDQGAEGAAKSSGQGASRGSSQEDAKSSGQGAAKSSGLGAARGILRYAGRARALLDEARRKRWDPAGFRLKPLAGSRLSMGGRHALFAAAADPAPSHPGMSRTSFITGRLVCSETGRPIAGGVFIVLHKSAEWGSVDDHTLGSSVATWASSDSSGHFRTISPLARGRRYQVGILAHGRKIVRVRGLLIPSSAGVVYRLGQLRLSRRR